MGNELKGKRNIIFGMLGLLTLIIVVAYGWSYQKAKKNSILGPIGEFSQQISDQRYKDGKAVRIYLKNSVTDSQAVAFREELLKQPNVKGISYVSKIGVIESIKSQQNVSTLSAETMDKAQAVMDVFVLEPSMKVGISNFATSSSLVDRVEDIGKI
jgi:ABC-type lipoprotein release transport system permease subunit